jgi:hypothetical protein
MFFSFLSFVSVAFYKLWGEKGNKKRQFFSLGKSEESGAVGGWNVF